MIDPYDSYKMYMALKLHFESDSYDALKYNFKTSIKPSSFYKRKDKYFFAKIAKKYEKNIMDFYVANFVKDVVYVGNMLGEEGESNYTNWKKYNQALTYNFNKDINTIADYMDECGWKFEDLFTMTKGLNHPRAATLYLKHEISLETLCILNNIFKFAQREKVTDILLWPDLKRKIIKYGPFLKYDTNKIMDMLKKRFT